MELLLPILVGIGVLGIWAIAIGIWRHPALVMQLEGIEIAIAALGERIRPLPGQNEAVSARISMGQPERNPYER